MPKGQDYRNRFLEWLKGGQFLPFAPISGIYLALFTNNPGRLGMLSREISYVNYSRQVFTPGEIISQDDSATLSNVNQIVFPPIIGYPTEFDSVISYILLSTYLTPQQGTYDGGVLYYGPMNKSIIIKPNLTIIFPPGSLAIRES